MDAAFAWPGGKKNLKRILLQIIPPHELYAEVFAGSAKLLFAKTPSALEVLNDSNGDLINFFRVAKHRAAELSERLEAEVIHASRFRELRGSAAPQDELGNAMRFAYLTWYSFGAKGQHFASSGAHGRWPRALDGVRAILQAVTRRLAKVLIEERDFAEIITRYDSAGTFFYLDPPYCKFSSNSRYRSMGADRRAEMFDRLASCKGKFLLSFDDCAEIRALARRVGLKVRSVSTSYSLSSQASSRKKIRREVLIANYPLHFSPSI